MAEAFMGKLSILKAKHYTSQYRSYLLLNSHGYRKAQKDSETQCLKSEAVPNAPKNTLPSCVNFVLKRKGWEREKKHFCSLVSSQMDTTSRIGPAKAGGLALHLHFQQSSQAPKHLAMLHCFPRCINTEFDWRWNTWNQNLHYYGNVAMQMLQYESSAIRTSSAVNRIACGRSRLKIQFSLSHERGTKHHRNVTSALTCMRAITRYQVPASRERFLQQMCGIKTLTV